MIEFVHFRSERVRYYETKYLEKRSIQFRSSQVGHRKYRVTD